MAEHYAFIGLGAMGYAMASNVRKKMPASSILYINDINQAACQRFKDEFASLGPIEIVASAREAADDAKFVLSIVPAADDVKDVYLDEENGVIAARPDEERIMCECSTIDVQTTKDVGEALRARGMGTYIDTPVSGGVPAASRGDLSLLIGHPAPARSNPTPVSTRLTTLLTHIGDAQKCFYLTDLGAGLTAKICNNYLAGTILLATSEALAIGIAHGLDPKALYDVIRASSGQSWMCDNVMPVPNVVDHWVPSNSGYRPGFKTQMMVKDLALGVSAGWGVGIRPAMAESALGVWEEAAGDERCVDRDGSSVYLFVGGRLPAGYGDRGRRGEGGEWVFE